jgi:lysophospholipase L1-like esterase
LATRYPIIKNIIFSSLFIFIFFAILEFTSRILIDGGGKSGHEDNIQFSVDQDLFWHYKPDQYVSKPSKGIYYLINSFGLRGIDFPLNKPAGEKRILAIGDSVTFGHLVSEESTYPYFLQEYLQEAFVDTSLRVINCGVSTYSTREELMFLQRKGIKYDPDIVILGFVLNDASIYARQNHLNKLRETLKHSETMVVLWEMRRNLFRFHFVRAIGRLLKVIPGDQSKSNIRKKRIQLNRDIMYLESEDAIRGWEITINELDEINNLLNDHQIGHVLVIFPTRYQLDENPIPNKPQERMMEFCRSNRIPFLDLLPTFINHNLDSLYMDQIHLKPKGNVIVAKEIGDFLIEKSFFED